MTYVEARQESLWLCDGVLEGLCDCCAKPRFLHEVDLGAAFYVCDNCLPT